MPRLIAFLSDVLGRPVVDRTDLEGSFDLDLRYRPDVGLSDQLTDSAKADLNTRPALPAALREQLGLQLQSRRLQLPLVVVDTITRPAPD
jgi:uncharacterized protein (TIGR03435 family)